MCDLAYVLLLDLLERQTLADRQVVAMHNASGRFEQAALPSLDDARRKFDEVLAAEPVAVSVSPVDVEQLELRQALGVA